MTSEQYKEKEQRSAYKGLSVMLAEEYILIDISLINYSSSRTNITELWNIASAFYLYPATVPGNSNTEYQHNLSRQMREQKALDVSCHFMRLFSAIIISLVWSPAFGQDTISLKKDIDTEVHRIQANSRLKPVTFSIQAMKKVLHYISYSYTENENGYVKISRQFSRKNDTTRQMFYLKKDQLIFATEKIVSFYTENNQTDSITWSGDFYFSKGKLIDHVTLGHGKSELDSWDPEQDLLNAFNESKQDIDRYKKKKNGS